MTDDNICFFSASNITPWSLVMDNGGCQVFLMFISSFSLSVFDMIFFSFLLSFVSTGQLVEFSSAQHLL